MIGYGLGEIIMPKDVIDRQEFAYNAGIHETPPVYNPGMHEELAGDQPREVSRRGFLAGLATVAVGVYAIKATSSESGVSEQNLEESVKNTLDLPELELPNLSLPQESLNRFNQHYPKIELMRPVYEAVEQQTGVPWKYMAALHYREGSNRPEASMYAGERLGTKNPDFKHVMESDIFQNGVGAARHFIANAKAVYGVEVTKDMTEQSLAYAFLAFNRGSMYKNAQKHIGREMTPDESPYVMNGLDDSHMNMRWPNAGSYSGSSRDWGEPQSVRGKHNSPLGALTIVRGIDMLAGGETVADKKIVLIGDSLTVGDDKFANIQKADKLFNKEIIHIDAHTGRGITGPNNAIEALRSAKEQINLANVLLFAIGTNIAESNEIFEQKIREAVDFVRSVKSIEVVIPELLGYKQGTQKANQLAQRNEILKRLNAEGLIRLLPLEISNSQFEQDKVHLTVDGYKARTTQILQAI
jgi:hypothetical protein